MTKPKHPGRTKAERRVLDDIGCGNYAPIMMKATRDRMINDGLIMQIESKVVGRFAGMPIMQPQFDMPIRIHMQWCDAVGADP